MFLTNIFFGLYFMTTNVSFANSVQLVEVNLQQEMADLKGTQNPQPDVSIEYFFVLSGSNSYLKKPKANCTDLEDDYHRMNLAISTAKQVAALKANVDFEDLNLEILRQYGPKIIYNGSEGQNNDLKFALENTIGFHYPQENFIILDIPKDEINTKGQFISLKQYLPLESTSVGIVTHAYHFPRVSRMLSQEAHLYPFGPNVLKFAFLVDRQFQSPNIEFRVKDEIRKIPIYIEKGDLSNQKASDVILFRE